MMMSFITVCFIGGMYVDNPGETFRVHLEDRNRYLCVSPRGSSNDAIDEYRALQEELPSMLPPEAQEILYINRRYIDYDCIMLFNCTTDCLMFTSSEDFELFKARTGDMVPENVHLKDHEMAMSELLANNRGNKIGEPIAADSKFVLSNMMDKKGMEAYAVAETTATNWMLILSNDGNCDMKLHEDLDHLAREIVRKYPHVYVVTNTLELEDVEHQISFMYYIFVAIVILVAIVLLITINAAFTAAYDKRKHEFAIYKAIGFTKGQIFRKIASEVLVMNGAAGVLGAILNAGVILVLNQVFWSAGHHFYRVSSLAVGGTVIAEVVIIATIILLNWHKVKKCEVTEE